MLLIITPNEFRSAAETLKVHKEKYGMLTSIATLEDDVYPNCEGVDEAEKVKRYIEKCYKDRDLRYVLLMGDSDKFPVRYTATDRKDDNIDEKKNKNTHNIAFYAADLYYACLYKKDGSFDTWNNNGNSYYGELFGETHSGKINIDNVYMNPLVGIGRAPVSNLTEADNFVQKTINYEKNAYNSNWAKKALLTATNDWKANAYEINNRIATVLTGYTCTKLVSAGTSCPGASGLTASNITNKFNEGIGLFTYFGHGTANAKSLALPNTDDWGNDDLNPQSGQNKIPINNKNMLPIMCVNACHSATFAPEPPYTPYTDKNGTHHAGTRNGEVFTKNQMPPQPACIQTKTDDPDNDMARNFLVTKDTGAVAYFGGITGLQRTEPVEFLVNNFQTNWALGDAWKEMVLKYYREVFDMNSSLSKEDWTITAKAHSPWKTLLFGDPSLRIGGAPCNTWSHQQKTRDDEKTSHGPTLCSFNGKLYAAWKGCSSNGLYISSFNGSKWAKQTCLTDIDGRKSSHAPALAVYNNKLYMAWKGCSSNSIYISSFNGSTWTNQIAITTNERKTSDAPALAVYKDKLYMAWKGCSSNSIYISSFNGSTWTNQTCLTDIDERKSSHTPALAVYDNKLYMAWKGCSSNSIYISSFNGSTWTNQTAITTNERKTSHAPTLAAYNNKLYMAWKGNTTRIYVSSFKGSTWTSQNCLTTADNRETSDSPVLAAHENRLYMAWKEKGNDPHISFSYLQLD